MSIKAIHPPTVGFFPSTFPRDPLEINIFNEHMLIGQVLEPLISCDSEGRIHSAVASHWKVTPKADQVELKINQGIKFSNGKPVTPDDIIYSIRRNLTAKRSQSYPFLATIKSIESSDINTVTIKLSRPSLAVLKALSREQLGIVPKNWTFNPKNIEPYVGTGPYRLIKEESEWILQINENFRQKDLVKIKKWKIAFHRPEKKIDAQPLPDLLLYLAPENYTLLANSEKKETFLKMHEEKLVHFFQSTGWWYPHGPNFTNAVYRKRAMNAVYELFYSFAQTQTFKLSKGIIPEGIAGAPTNLPLNRLNKIEHENHPLLSINLAVFKHREYQLFKGSPLINAVEKKWNVKIKFIPIEPTQLNTLPKLKPDIAVLSFGGGFHDPEGFLLVVSNFLQSDLETVFSELYPKYLEASLERSAQKRAKKFREFAIEMTETGRSFPGWKQNFRSLHNDKLEKTTSSLRYSPSLIDYDFRKEVPWK